MNTNQLREVAAAATPGPWDYVANGEGLPRSRIGVTIKDSIGGGYSSHCVALVSAIHGFDDIDLNAAHIATFNPALVMKLLAALDAASELYKCVPERFNNECEKYRAAIKALEE